MDTSQLYTDGMLSVKLASQMDFTPVTVYIFPNPLFKGTTPTVQYTLEQSTRITFDLYNMFGHQLYSTQYESGENGGKIDLNTISIPQGIIDQLAIGPYFIIIHNNHQTFSKGIFTIK